MNTAILSDGLGFPEGPRWHDGSWWVSDFHRREVLRVDPSGGVAVVAHVPAQPSGLGWLPDGRLLVVSMLDRHVLVVDSDGETQVHADLSSVAPGPCNDMVVDGQGRAYVGNFMATSDGSQDGARLTLVTADGRVDAVAEDLALPNGMAITPDGDTLICAETVRHRLTAWDRGSDGRLTRQRVWADLGELSPDGIALDAEGAVWFADPFSCVVARVAEGGEILERVSMGDRGAYACALGGMDRKTLLICSNSVGAFLEPELREGRLETAAVDVAGAGWP